MNGRHDPFALLRQLNPIASEHVTADDEDRLQAILDGRAVKAADRRLRRRVLALAAAAMVVSAGAASAAWVVLHRNPVTNPLTIACHRTATLDGDVAVVAEAADPVAACAPLWSDGTLGTGPAPELVACTSDAGLAVVFPGGPDVCQRLGLADFAPRSLELQAVSELHSRLLAEFGQRCVGEEDAFEFASRVLAALGLDDWVVAPSRPFTPERACAAMGVDPSTRTVSIGGRPARGLAPPASAAP